MNGCFLWNRVKAWSSIQRKFQMIKGGNFCFRFWSLQYQQSRFSKIKKQHQRYYKISRSVVFFFSTPPPPFFFLKDQNWGDGMPPPRTPQLNGQARVQTQHLILKCFSSLKTPLYRGAELPHFHIAISEIKLTLGFPREKGSLSISCLRCQDGLKKLPVACKKGKPGRQSWKKCSYSPNTQDSKDVCLPAGKPVSPSKAELRLQLL